MPTSHLDYPPHIFQCENPQCGNAFEKSLGSLVYANEVVCPKCGTSIDIRESKRTGDLGLWFSTAGELDKLDKLDELKKKN